jgi:hypothetical protein
VDSNVWGSAPRPQPLQRCRRIVAKRFVDVLAHKGEVAFQDLEAERFLRSEVVGERPLRHPRGLDDVADAGAVVPLLEHNVQACRQQFFTMRWLRHSLRTTQVSVRRKRVGPPDAVSQGDALIRPPDPERPEREDEARPSHCLKTTRRLLRLHLYPTRSDLNKPLLRCLNRDIPSSPRRKLDRLSACYLVCERNAVVRIRA